MNEVITCPHCGQKIPLSSSEYDVIANQIRNEEFTKEVEERVNVVKDAKNQEIETLKARANEALSARLSARDAEEAQRLRTMEQEYHNKISSLQQENVQKIAQMEVENNRKMTEKEQIISSLKTELETKDEKYALEKKQLADQISFLKESEKEKALNEKDKEITRLQNEIILKNQKNETDKLALKSEYELELRKKDAEITNQQRLVEQYKDFKARQSTKMIGESLEQHCSYEFNRCRMGMFPTAYFEKDNDIRSGSKGDFIFRDYDSDGKTEIVSIMFEMKNEADTTATKHKNEDFFKELDKDRREKKCEYAILVSMLESDNDLYNEGIVDVSYRYPKMYVIRPQFFIPIITLLRNASLKSLEYKHELQKARENNLDIAHFEENMEEFKSKFGANYTLASKKFTSAVEDIDKAIKQLEKIKESLLSSERNLRLANDKAQNLSIKQLTHNAPKLREQFDELKNN